MVEPARKLPQDVETFKAAVRNLDETGFKKEVAKRAAVQSQNLELRDAIADIAADEFGDAGRQTVIQLWEGMRTVGARFEKIEEAKPKPMVCHNGRRYPADVWEEHQRKKAASFLSVPQPKADEAKKDNAARKAEPSEEPAEEPAGRGAEPIKASPPAIVPPQLPPATWDDLLTAMNNQHAIIDNVGGKTVIASWEPSSLDPTRLMVAFQNKESFLLRYSNRYATIDHH
jgi:hypothetical protein